MLCTQMLLLLQMCAAAVGADAVYADAAYVADVCYCPRC